MSNTEKGSHRASKKDMGKAAQDRVIQEALYLIKHKFLVMSGKDGVGKTSVAANLAVALSKRGTKVGLMDVDLHGPNIPKVLGLKGHIEVSADKRFIPKPYLDNMKEVTNAYNQIVTKIMEGNQTKPSI